MMNFARRIARLIPERLRRPAFWGSLKRREPFSRTFGADRGLPICWHYIRAFLRQHETDIRGRVLEIGDDTYIRMFGGERVTHTDILHVEPGSPGATVIADLSSGDGLDRDIYDCVIVTQTLNSIYDVKSAVETLHRILKPGGVVLATLPGISQITRYDMDRWGDFWRFTTASAERLFEGFASSEVRSWGNVSSSIAYLAGLAVEDVGIARLEDNDPDYQMLVTVRAVKAINA